MIGLRNCPDLLTQVLYYYTVAWHQDEVDLGLSRSLIRAALTFGEVYRSTQAPGTGAHALARARENTHIRTGPSPCSRSERCDGQRLQRVRRDADVPRRGKKRGTAVE